LGWNRGLNGWGDGGVMDVLDFLGRSKRESCWVGCFTLEKWSEADPSRSVGPKAGLRFLNNNLSCKV
jgi:hypothetical protein